MPSLHMLLLLAVTGGLGFLVTLCAIPIVKRIAERVDLLSYPGGHSSHDKPIPLLGGAAMLLGVLAAYLFFQMVLTKQAWDMQFPGFWETTSLVLGATWMCLLGTLDDKLHLGWKKKVLGELIGVGIIIAGGHTITVATIPYVGLVEFGWWGAPIFALMILTITNAVNLIDGIDGLAGGICFFAALVTGIIGLATDDLFAASMGFGIAGAALAFLVFNFPPASIFMGDGGSLFLGFLLGTMATSSAATAPGLRPGAMVMLLVPFLPFGIALLDVLLSILRRGLSGRRIFLPDTDHLHHRLMEKVGRPRAVVGILYSFSALLSAMTLSLILGDATQFFSLYVLLSGVVLLGLVVLVLRLYMREGLPTIIENRPHMKYLASYMDFMNRRARRSCNEHELLQLLESGVRDLGFDSVAVLQQGQERFKWERLEKQHPEAERLEETRVLGVSGYTVQVFIPKHHSHAYQKYLKLVWDQFLKEAARQLKDIQAGICRLEDSDEGPHCVCEGQHDGDQPKGDEVAAARKATAPGAKA